MSSSRPAVELERPPNSRFDTRNRRYHQIRDKLIRHQLKVIKVANMIERPPWLWQPHHSVSREEETFVAPYVASTEGAAARLLQTPPRLRDARQRRVKRGDEMDGIKVCSSYFIPGITGRARCLEEGSSTQYSVDDVDSEASASRRQVVVNSKQTQPVDGQVALSRWDVPHESPEFWRSDVSYQSEGYDANDMCHTLLASLDLANQLNDTSRIGVHDDSDSLTSSVDESLIEKRLQYIQLQENPDRDNDPWNVPDEEHPISEESASSAVQTQRISRHQSTEISPKRTRSHSVFTVPKILFQKDRSGVSNRSVNTTWTVGTTISGTTSNSDIISLQALRVGSMRSNGVSMSREFEEHDATLCGMVSMPKFKNSE